MRIERRVVITGAGVLSPIGTGVDAFWQALCEGRSGAGPLTLFDCTGYDTTFACELKGFDPEQYLKKVEAKRMDPFCQYGMIAAMLAIDDAGLDLSTLDMERAGVIMASGIGGMTVLENTHRILLEKGPGRVPPMFIPMMISDIVAGQIAMKYGFKGPNYVTVSACASSSHALGNALRTIQHGEADLVVSGGCEASITPLSVAGFNALKALSTRNDDPLRASRPFDRDRDGFVMGEGGAVLVLEELEHARRRGARIYGEFLGMGYTADAHHLTAPAPEGEGAQRSMRIALKDAGLEPGDIGHVNTHGTSTPAGDIAEIQAINRVFGGHAGALLVNSTKSMTGHLLGAAGAIEFLATLLAVREGKVPPTINIENLDPEVNLHIVRDTPESADLRAALSNTFGFGGHNASLVVGRFDN
jgi:3-oxoacyl-[acyl-carrier-protein] synthase II